MKNINYKGIATKLMIAGYLLIAGAIAGGYFTHQYDTHQNKTTEQAVQAALKSVPVAQASAPLKAQSR